MQASQAIATAMNTVQTGHSYGDIMLHMKAQEAKQVCSFSYWLQLYLNSSCLLVCFFEICWHSIVHTAQFKLA